MSSVSLVNKRRSNRPTKSCTATNCRSSVALSVSVGIGFVEGTVVVLVVGERLLDEAREDSDGGGDCKSMAPLWRLLLAVAGGRISSLSKDETAFAPAGDGEVVSMARSMEKDGPYTLRSCSVRCFSLAARQSRKNKSERLT